MVRAEGYEEGLNAFLNRKINPRDLLEDAKGILYSTTKVIPGIGLGAHYIKERRGRKGKSLWYNLKEAKDRKALGVYAIETGYLALAIAWKVYLGNGVATGNWPPFKYSKDRDMHKKELELKKDNELEKTITYEDILKVIG